MKLSIQLRLTTDADTTARFRETRERFNAACNWISRECFTRQELHFYSAQALVYREVRSRFGLSSQMSLLAIKSVCDAYKINKTVRVKFRRDAAVPFDRRTLSFKSDNRVSILTLTGRVVVPFLLGPYQAARLPLAKGQCDLVRRKDGRWFLHVTIDVAPAEQRPTNDFLGVDLGIVNIATDSDGNVHSGGAVEAVRRKHSLQRKRLQRRGTKGAKKKLRRIAGKEARFRRHENHCVSKTIVGTAKRTARGIAREELTGIGGRIRARSGDARDRLSGWTFAQLGRFIGYKAALAGVPDVLTDPRDSSRTCSRCGYCAKANRKSQSAFLCGACGYTENADVNAARNHRLRALGALKPPIELATFTG